MICPACRRRTSIDSKKRRSCSYCGFDFGPVRVKTYFIHSPKLEAMKIGISRDVARRLDDIRKSNPDSLTILRVVDGDHEGYLHHKFAEHRISGEWFAAAPVMAWLMAQEVTR